METLSQYATSIIFHDSSKMASKRFYAAIWAYLLRIVVLHLNPIKEWEELGA